MIRKSHVLPDSACERLHVVDLAEGIGHPEVGGLEGMSVAFELARVADMQARQQIKEGRAERLASSAARIGVPLGIGVRGKVMPHLRVESGRGTPKLGLAKQTQSPGDGERHAAERTRDHQCRKGGSLDPLSHTELKLGDSVRAMVWRRPAPGGGNSGVLSVTLQV